MKNLFLILLLCIFSLSSIAQPKQAPKPKPTVAASTQPKGPVPYVYKKDYDSNMVKLNNQLKSVQQSIGSIKGGINGKDAEIKGLSEKMKQVEDVLNSTNFKIATTTDSLSKTKLSLEEFAIENDKKFSDLESNLDQAKGTIKLFWGLIIAALLIGITSWIVLIGKINSLDTKLKKLASDYHTSIEELKSSTEQKVQDLETQLRNESRSNYHFAERMGNSAKDGISEVKIDLNTLKSTLEVLTSEMSELTEKVNSSKG
jgi:chromosome segregation ATPase